VQVVGVKDRKVYHKFWILVGGQSSYATQIIAFFTQNRKICGGKIYSRGDLR
jgi:hypothetical protein